MLPLRISPLPEAPSAALESPLESGLCLIPEAHQPRGSCCLLSCIFSLTWSSAATTCCAQAADGHCRVACASSGVCGDHHLDPGGSPAEPDECATAPGGHSQRRHPPGAGLVQVRRWQGAARSHALHAPHLLRVRAHWRSGLRHARHHHVLPPLLLRSQPLLLPAGPPGRPQLAPALEVPPLERLPLRGPPLHWCVLPPPPSALAPLATPPLPTPISCPCLTGPPGKESFRLLPYLFSEMHWAVHMECDAEQGLLRRLVPSTLLDRE